MIDSTILASITLVIGIIIAFIVMYRRGVGEAYANFPWGWWLVADMTALVLIVAGGAMLELRVIMWAMES